MSVVVVFPSQEGNCKNLQRGRAQSLFWTSRLLLPRLRRVFLADNRGQAKVSEASEHLGSNIGTVLVVTEIFSEQFFASVWSGEARLDRYPRNRESPNRTLLLSDS
jgi:hypothetical protein